MYELKSVDNLNNLSTWLLQNDLRYFVNIHEIAILTRLTYHLLVSNLYKFISHENLQTMYTAGSSNVA